MELCKQCEMLRPLSEYGFYPSGTRRCTCNPCRNANSRKSKLRKKMGLIERSYTAVRHPNEAEMEADVKERVRSYQKKLKALEKAGISPDSMAGKCDEILGNK